MTFETAEAVFQYAVEVAHRLKAREVVELNLYGGEPFLNFSVVRRLVELARRIVGCRVTIFTNGATATTSQVTWCRVNSVHHRRSTAGSPLAASTTRPGDYTARWLDEGVLWQDHSATHRMTVTPATAHYVCHSVRWLHLHGHYGPIDLATDDYAAWTPEAQVAYSDQIKKLAREFVRQYKRGFVLGVENFSNFGRALFGQGGASVLGCGACWNTLGITWDSRIVSCHRAFREPAESPLCGGTLADLLAGRPTHFGPAVVGTIRGWADGGVPELCASCDARAACPQGCLHVAWKSHAAFVVENTFRCVPTRLYAAAAREINEELGGDWWRKPATVCQPFVEE
jgi:radical SAM protein with 4Fe4S-binding SPASM domain